MLGMMAVRKRAETAADAAARAAERDRLNRRLSVIRSACSRARLSGDLGDGRTCRREGVYKVASAKFVPDQDTSCRIVDQSSGGFRLAFHEMEPIPEEFALTIPTLRFIGIVRRIWQHGTEVGVSVIKLPDAA